MTRLFLEVFGEPLQCLVLSGAAGRNLNIGKDVNLNLARERILSFDDPS